MTPSIFELEQAIAEATRKAVKELFKSTDEHFYYCCLITTGQAHSPFLSAWSREALNVACGSDEDLKIELEWSSADSPYCFFGECYFKEVDKAFSSRPEVTATNDEYSIRLKAMENALAVLDSEGLFGHGQKRNSIYINVEVIPPDKTNTERAIRLNPGPGIKNG
jgi:hypothetical protein